MGHQIDGMKVSRFKACSASLQLTRKVMLISMKNVLILSLFTIGISFQSFAQSRGFQIVFSIEPRQFTPEWLAAIKQHWGATGVSVWLPWGSIEPTPNTWKWDVMDGVVNSVLRESMDVHIRVPMDYRKPDWVSPTGPLFSSDDFHYMASGKLFDQFLFQEAPPWCPHDYILNFTSEKSRFYMLRYYAKVLEHIKQAWPNKLTRFKCIIPSLTWDSEMEYPYQRMCGYSPTEISAFRKFLARKYRHYLDTLKHRWNNAPFTSWEDIDPKLYGWDNIVSSSTYQYPSGRIDWMEFRTAELKRFIDTCARVTHSQGLKIGLQFGSIYDNNIEKRWGVDPTPLIENVDRVINGDVIEYKPNFGFAADYIRSLCQYWSRIKGRKIEFSTESNNPTYNGYSPAAISDGWIAQLTAYYNKGADCHVIVAWFTGDVTAQKYYDEDFKKWSDTLRYFSGRLPLSLKGARSIYLGNESVHLHHNTGRVSGTLTTDGKTLNYYSFKLLDSVVLQGSHDASAMNKDSNVDIVTNYMIANPAPIDRSVMSRSRSKPQRPRN